MFRKSLIYSIAVLFIVSCATQVKTRYRKTSYFDLVDNSQAKQTNAGITVELLPLDDDVYKKSYYTQNVEVVYTPFLADQPVAEEKPFQFAYFDKLTTFKVNIINNTDHILRMRDSRIAFIDPDSDEPVMALNKTEILDDIESAIPCFTKMKNFLVKKYPQTKPSYIEEGLSKAMTKITKKIKFINGFNKEIMPGMKSSGILMFPVSPEQASQGKISFIDLVSKTDKAGNPVERVRIDYRVKVLHQYWKYNKQTDKEWVKINKADYDKESVQK